MRDRALPSSAWSLAAWPPTTRSFGTHAVRAEDEVALVSGVDTVTLLDVRGEPVWTFRHEAPWQNGGFERGCAWFDDAGEPFAMVPRQEYDGCDVVHLGRRDGRPLERVRIDTDPGGTEAIHHPDGRIGLSVGEGQDGVFAWWTRLDAGGLELIEAPWADEVLFDVDPAGEHVLTTPHSEGPLRVRAFPGLGGRPRDRSPGGHVLGLLCVLRRRAHRRQGDRGRGRGVAGRHRRVGHDHDAREVRAPDRPGTRRIVADQHSRRSRALDAQRRNPALGGASVRYRYGDSNPGFRRERAAS